MSENKENTKNKLESKDTLFIRDKGVIQQNDLPKKIKLDPQELTELANNNLVIEKEKKINLEVDNLELPSIEIATSIDKKTVKKPVVIKFKKEKQPFREKIKILSTIPTGTLRKKSRGRKFNAQVKAEPIQLQQQIQGAQTRRNVALPRSRKKKKSFAKTLAKIAGASAIGGTVLPLMGGHSADAATLLIDLIIK